MYILFNDTTLTTKHLAEGIAADYEAQGRLAGIKILDAMKRLDDPTTYPRGCCYCPTHLKVKLRFDPNQSFQLDAVDAVTLLFDGQPQGVPEYAVIHLGAMEGLFAGQERTELGVGSRPAAGRGQAAREPEGVPASQRHQGHGPGRRAGGVGVKTI